MTGPTYSHEACMRNGIRIWIYVQNISAICTRLDCGREETKCALRLSTPSELENYSIHLLGVEVIDLNRGIEIEQVIRNTH